MGGGGGGLLPIISYIGMCHHNGRVFVPFGLKSVFGLELGVVFEGTTGLYERIILSFQFQMC